MVVSDISYEKMIVNFKGQLLTKKYLVSYVIISLITFTLVFALYYFIVYDLLFQLFNLVISGPTSLMMLIVPPILIWLYLSFVLASFYYPKTVTISLDEAVFDIEFGKTKIQIPFQEITEIMFVKRSGLWDRITIKTDRTIHINIGTIFKGVEIPEMEAILVRLKNVLSKRYQLYYYANTAIENNHTFSFSKKEFGETRKNLIVKLSLVGATVFAVIIIAVAIIISSKAGGDSLLHAQGIGKSVFATYNGKVYALKVGDGHFELKGVDINTFKPFVFDREYGTLLGKDEKNVFASDEKLVGIDVNNAAYLGLSYIKDAKHVFYKTLKVDGADVATFKSLKHSAGFNTPGFKYATDKSKVYYKNLVVKFANPNTVSSVDRTFDYIKDNRNAFYRTQVLPNVNVRNFYAVETNYQIVYASDGKKHFVNGMQFPPIVNNKLFGTTNVDTSNLVILQKAVGNSRHLLFSDNKAIYYYDDYQNEFICADNLPEIRPLNDGGFTDGQSYYFTQTVNLLSRKYGSSGSQTTIYKTNFDAKNLAIFHRLEGSTIYKNGNDYYISIDSKSSSLYRIIDFPTFDKEIIKAGRTYVGDDKYFEAVANTELVLKIKTRSRTNFEDEND